jgi:hypothetical protein
VIGLRLKVWVTTTQLDRRLAEGTTPACSPELALRARQLASTRGRRSLAIGLRRAAEATAVPRLVTIAHRLESGWPVDVRGLALVSWLLCDVGSPMHDRHAEVDLQDMADRAWAAL